MKPLHFKEENLNERSRRNLSILETIRRSGPVSKADISRVSGLNIVTITNYIDHYIRSKLVNFKALDVSAGGRRPALLELNANAGLAIGVGLNLLDMVGVVVDLNGNVVERVVRGRPEKDVTDIVDAAVDIIGALFDNLSEENRKKVNGVGIGIAGVIDKNNGTICWPQRKIEGGCEYVSIYAPVKETIEKKFSVPCILENDATVSCFGEQWINLDADIENLIYMFSGVGSGFILNGEVYRGATGSAGEIALKDYGADDSLEAQFQDAFFLKPWEDDLGIVRRVKESLKKNSKGKILELAGNRLEDIDLRMIFQAAKNGDPLAGQAVRQAGSRLGVKVAFLINLLNPEIVVIGGGMEEGGSILLNAVKETVSKYSFAEMANAVKILPSRLGNNAVAIGAASLVIRQTFAYI